ncbi:MAG: 3-octaprenyl-4-hydroxybenzoate carboxy-lyase, partial [Bacteroidota bacterium]
NMKRVTEAGGIILPAIPSFYSKPKSIEEVIDTVVHRLMDMAGLSLKTYRWGEKEGS